MEQLDDKKTLAEIAQKLRNTGFKGKIEPHLNDGTFPQMSVYSYCYGNLLYHIRVIENTVQLFLYMNIIGHWKPIKTKGYIDYDEQYDGYAEYLYKTGYSKAVDEYITISNILGMSHNTVIKTVNDISIFDFDDENIEQDNDYNEKQDDEQNKESTIEPDYDSIFRSLYKPKKRSLDI